MYAKVAQTLVAITAFCVSLPLHAHAVLPKQLKVPGGVAIVDLGVNSIKPPRVYYLNKRVCVVSNPKKAGTWLAVVGIPLDAPIGQNQLEIRMPKQTKSKQISFMVAPKKYPTQHIQIKDTRKVEPHPGDLQVIEQQYLETIKSYAQWQDKGLKSLRLSLPVVGRKSSPFGLQRVFNNIPKNPHTGLDIAAKIGTPVKCPKDGKVINVGNYFYTGNIIFVQHGQGFITSYCHLDKILVKSGQDVKKNQIIGTVGKTGRATGPHLHWSVSLNEVRVDPQLFIAG